MVKSKYVLYVENLSSATRSSDVKREFEHAGPVYEVERDYKTRSALVEMRKSADAEYAWKKMDGLSVDGRKIKIDYATKEDFKFFGWKVPEDMYTPSPSRSRSPVRSTRSDSD
ncbi:hypothetical protein WJX75_003185 [Coccomyxa subellipsoidea]|uniref:RRM domain-containing protein n=1 Tax=Coccomyxa subellipsoidea TaxID=248742 RepID=A0ABR2YM78_9CHLO